MSDSLNQAYVGSISEMEEIILTPLFEFIPSTSSNYSLVIYDDGTYTYGDEANSITENGSYDWVAALQKLTLILPDASEIAATTSGNIITIEYAAVTAEEGITSSETFIGSAEKLLEVLPSAEALYEFAATSVSEGNSMTFVIYNDYTFVMAYSLYGYTGEVYGTWTFDGSDFTCALEDGTAQEVTTEGDIISINFSYGMTQTFTGSLAALRAATGYYEESEDHSVIYELEATSLSGNNTMDLYLYDDGTIGFEYSLYGYTGSETGWYAWYDSSSTLAIVYSNYDVVYSYLDSTDSDILYIDYVSPASSSLSQTFKGSVAGLSEALSNVGALYEFAATSVSEGNSMTFVIYDDYSFIMSYYLYGYEGDITGTWTFDGSNFACATSDGTEQTVTVDGDIISIAFSYSGMSQTFTGSLAALRVVTGYYEENEEHALAYSFEATSVSEGNSMTLSLYDDGTWAFDYYLYGYSGSDSGWYAWYEESSTFVLVYNDYTVAYSYADENDSDVIYIDYVMPGSGGSLSQTFKGSVSGLNDVLSTTTVIYEFAATSVSEGNSMTFVLNSNHTFTMSYYLYGYSGDITGTWTFDGSNFTCATDDGTSQAVTISGDVISIAFSYSGMSQTFTGSLAALRAATGYYDESTSHSEAYSLAATSVSTGNSMDLHLYDDGTFAFEYSLYGYTGSETGWYEWYESSSTLVLVYNDYSVAYSYADTSDSDTFYIDYVSPASSALSQTFQGSVSAITAALS